MIVGCVRWTEVQTLKDAYGFFGSVCILCRIRVTSILTQMVGHNLRQAGLHIVLLDLEMVGSVPFRIRIFGDTQEAVCAPAAPENPALRRWTGSFKLCRDLPDPFPGRQIIDMDRVMAVGAK